MEPITERRRSTDAQTTKPAGGAQGPTLPVETPGSAGVDIPASVWPEPTILTWQDLVELPGQILPEQTRIHLKNAGREATLALFCLWKEWFSPRQSSADKAVRHIEVE